MLTLSFPITVLFMYVLRAFYFKNIITQTRLFKYIENYTTKNWKFSDINFDNFHISAQNVVDTR